MVVDEDFRPNPGRGKNTAYSYFVQACKDEHKKRFPGEQLLMSEFNKKLTDRWKMMSEREKRYFVTLSENDKSKPSSSSSAASRTPTSDKKARKPKRTKDPNAPKRALSGFFWFSQDERHKVKAANPDFGVGDVAKELGRRWSEVSEDVKAKYEALAANDRVRYDKEKMAYQSRLKIGSVGGHEGSLLDEDDD